MESIAHELRCLALAIGAAESFVSANLRLPRRITNYLSNYRFRLADFSNAQKSRSSQWAKRIDDVGNTVCRDQLIIFWSHESKELAGLPQQ